jgi:hypothetical protein
LTDQSRAANVSTLLLGALTAATPFAMDSYLASLLAFASLRIAALLRG